MNIAQEQSQGGEQSQQGSTESGAAIATIGGEPVDDRIAMGIQPVEVRLNIAADCGVQIAVDIVSSIGVHLQNKSMELQERN